MRPFTAAAVQVAPAPGPLTPSSVKANLDTCVDHVERCVAATGAELVVLPESATTGYTPGVDPATLWDLVSEVPGPVTGPLQEAAARLGVHLVAGTYERGAERGTVHNTAVLIGPTGAVLGSYRKTHVFYLEDRRAGGWVTRGRPGRAWSTPSSAAIGLLICYDGDFPELARAEAVLGAEVLCRPSALLRPADIWELTNRARAYDNHVFVVGANATGSDPAGTLYFGNSMIVSPVAEVMARATSHQGWCSARLDPATAMATITPGSSVPQRFDHLADRNLALVERHLDDLRRPARTSVPARAARADDRGRCAASGSGSTPAGPSPTSSPSTRTPASWPPPRPPRPRPTRPRGSWTGWPRSWPSSASAPRRSPPSATAPPWPPTSSWRARSAGSASSPPRGSGPCWRSPARASPTATATATSGSSRPGSSPPTWSGPSAAGSTTPGPSCAPSTRTRPGRPPGTSATGR